MSVYLWVGVGVCHVWQPNSIVHIAVSVVEIGICFIVGSEIDFRCLGQLLPIPLCGKLYDRVLTGWGPNIHVLLSVPDGAQNTFASQLEAISWGAPFLIFTIIS